MNSSATLAHLNNRLHHARYDYRIAYGNGCVMTWDAYGKSLCAKLKRLERATKYLDGRVWRERARREGCEIV